MRIPGRIKLGHYPTPPPVAKAIGWLLGTMNRDARFRLFDPCAGDGTALRCMYEAIKERHAKEWGRWANFLASTWGIEIDQVRAQQAQQKLDRVLHASFFATTLSTGNGPDRGWQVAFVNPPYDGAAEELEGTRSRQEVQFLKRATERLCTSGLMVWIIPQHVLGRRGVARYLAEHYDQQLCLRFPDAPWRPPGSQEEVEMYAQFKQVIWIGRKLAAPGPAEAVPIARIEAWATMGAHVPAIALEVPEEVPGDERDLSYAIPNAPTTDDVKHFLAGSFDPDGVARRIGQFSAKTGRPKEGVWANEDAWQLRFPDPRHAGLFLGRPLHSFKRGYVIVFAVAGLINQAVLTGKSGRRLLVKGHTRKVVYETERDDDLEIVTKQTDRFESSLWCLDLDRMELILVETGDGAPVCWPVEHETMSMQAFLEDFGDSLMEQVQRLNKPRYEGPHQVPWAKRAFAYVKRKPLGKQLDAILAQVHALTNPLREAEAPEEPLLLRLAEVAEMGAGKTYMAMLTAFLADVHACGCADLVPPGTRILSLFPMVVLSPAIMAPKWKRELEETLPHVRVLIVERFGSTRGGLDDEDDEDEDAQDLRAARGSPGTAALSDARSAFRQFDPEFTAASLGPVGSVDRAVARIRADLADWRTRYARVEDHNRTTLAAIAAGKARDEDLLPLPLKPCHVLILTFHTAKRMPAWMPLWRMKPARVIDRESGKVRVLRRRNEEQTPVLFPACPHCFRLAKDGQQFARELRANRTFAERHLEIESWWNERAREGRQLGLQVLAAEEQVQQYLLTLEPYAALQREQEALLAGSAPQDALYAELEQRMQTLLAHDAEYQALYKQREDASALGSPQQREATEKALQRFLGELPLAHQTYRQLIVAQDQRFRELQQRVKEQIDTYLSALEASDETYRQLQNAVRAASDLWRRFSFRVEAYEAEAREPTTLYLSESDLRGRKEYRVKRYCAECGEPLWQYIAKQPKQWQPFSVQQALPLRRVMRTSGVPPLAQWVGSAHGQPLPLPGPDRRPACITSTWRRSYALAKYLAEQHPGVFGLLIADEMHEGADGTALDQARQVLARMCGHMIGLTGTLSNGYASSLFRLYYTLMPSVRKDFAYEDTRRWIRLHGRMQTVRKDRYETPPTGTGSDSKRKISPGMPITKEIAGFDPTGMGKVARVSSLTELPDVVTNLVKYHEDIRIVSMGEVLGEAYAVFQEEITRKMRDLLREGDNSALSPWYHALLTVGDLPWQDYRCQTKHGFLLGTFPALPAQTIWPIEEALIQYVQEQHTAGYRVLVYTEHTGQYDEQERIKTLLERYVRSRSGRRLKVAILRSTTTKKSMDREAWLKRTVEEGVEVLICNPALVKVGLDLIAFPRIVYKSFPDKVSNFRQSSRRSWRPGQTEDVEVVVLAYQEAISLRLLHLMGRKTLSSLMVEGKIATEGLVSLGVQEEEEEGDITGQLAREMLAALEQGTLQETAGLAEEIQSANLSAARAEQEHHQRLGEETDPTLIFLEEIRQEPLRLPPPLDDDVTEVIAPAPSGETEPSLAEAPLAAQRPPETISVAPPPLASPREPERYVTIVPLPITTALPTPILAEAGMDPWALLRGQFGAGKKKRGGSKAKKR